MVLHRNAEGFLYGITYIDHRTKSVFKGSDLGKSYNASGIKQRLTAEETSIKSTQQTISSNTHSNDFKNDPSYRTKNSKNENGLIQILLNKENIESRFPIEFLKKKKKRRKNH